MNSRFPVDVDRLMASADIGMAGIRAGLNQKKEMHKEAKLRCSYCGKEDDEKKPLKACTQCREARYCDRECQVAHYKYQHKQDCASFKEPPLCRAWNTKTVLPGTRYPERPTFAQAHNDGVGCWISVAGSIDCCLATNFGDRLADRKKMSTADLLANLPGMPGSYLDLAVLVQNRRKAESVTVVGKAFLAVTTKEGKSTMMAGKQKTDIITMISHPTGGEVPAISPSFVKLTSVNGKEEKLKVDKAPSPALKDRVFCAVTLKPGDFAIFEAQYRIGGPSITKDFEALSLLDHILIPAVPYDPEFRGPYKDLLPRAANKGELCEVRARFNQSEIDDWYEDYITKGKKAYIASHYGEARAEMIDAGDTVMGQQLQLMMQMAAERMGASGGIPGL